MGQEIGLHIPLLSNHQSNEHLLYPQVDIVVLNYNGKRFFNACFGSLLQSTYPALQIYVVDNASTEDDVAHLREFYPNIHIIQNPLNNGYCAAYNLAFSTCTGKYLVCLNNDVIVKPDWIEHLVKLAESDETIAAAQPKILSYFDEKAFEYAGASGGMMDVYGYPFLRGRLFSTIEKDSGQYDDVREIFWTSGAAMFIRKNALEKSGVLDETIVHHMDEIDLCWRLRMAGYKLLVQPASVIQHIGGATIQPHSFKKVYWNHRNSLYIMLKNYEASNVFRKVPIHILLDYVAAVHALFAFNTQTVRGIFAAHLWLILNTALIWRKRKEVQKKRLRSDQHILPFLYKGSIVWEYFFCKRKTYNSLKYTNTNEYKINTRNPEWHQSAATVGSRR